MSEDEKTIVREFAKKQVKKGLQFFPQEHVFLLSDVEYPEIKTQLKTMKLPNSFELTHSMGYFSDTNEYDVFNLRAIPLGTGAFSVILKPSGKFDDDGFDLKPCNKAIKWQIHQDFTNYFELKNIYQFALDLKIGKKAVCQLEHLKNEYLNGNLSGLKINTPIYFPAPISQMSKFYSFMPLEFIEGDELFDILEKSREPNNPPLSTDLRIELTLQLLNAYLTTILVKEIIHLDLKPENIKLYIDLLKQKIGGLRIYDFGLSVRVGYNKQRCCGSVATVSPEIFFNGIPTQFADIYSLGIILGLIWGADQEDEDEEETNYYKELFSKDYVFKGLFDGINDLDFDHRKMIAIILHSMVRVKPTQRLVLDQQAKNSEIEPSNVTQLIFSRLKNIINILTKIQLSRVDRVADDLKSQLQAIVDIHKMSEVDPKKLLNSLKRSVNYSLSQIIDEPHVVKYFIQALGVKAFDGMQTKEDILTCVDELVNFIETNIPQLFCINKLNEAHQYTESILPKLASEYTGLFNEVLTLLKDRNLTIDNLVLLKNALSARLPKLVELNQCITLLLGEKNNQEFKPKNDSALVKGSLFAKPTTDNKTHDYKIYRSKSCYF